MKYATGPPLVLTKKLKYMDWASLKITKFSKCQTGPPLKSSLDGGNSPESLINWILGEAQFGTF